jgi:hypothetical protein
VELVLAHVGVVGGEQDAGVGREAGQHETPGAEVGEEEIERRAEEARMLGLEDEVVVLLGREQACHRLAADAVVQAVGDQGAEVRAPAAEVVVDIDDRNAGAPSLAGQGGDPPGDAHGRLQQTLAALELEVVDDVDQKERRAGVVGDVAVQIGRSHRLHADRGRAARSMPRTG